jgi:hypothetical protein
LHSTDAPSNRYGFRLEIAHAQIRRCSWRPSFWTFFCEIELSQTFCAFFPTASCAPRFLTFWATISCVFFAIIFPDQVPQPRKHRPDLSDAYVTGCFTSPLPDDVVDLVDMMVGRLTVTIRPWLGNLLTKLPLMKQKLACCWDEINKQTNKHETFL